MAGFRFKCADTGLKCSFEFSDATSRDEAMELARTHAIMAHHMSIIPADLASKIFTAIKP